jgi:NADH dehydrogenase
MRQKIVIVGGGFAGLNLIKQLSKMNEFEVVLVDLNNYHFFPPLIYQVGTSFIEASNISYPFRKMFQSYQNVRYFNGAFERVDTVSKTIFTSNGSLQYDYLVLAMGTETNYFGMENVKKNSLPLKTIDDALHLRNELLLNLESACRTKDNQDLVTLTNIVIAGGGPTGVEVAGMLAEMGKHIAAKDYPELPRRMQSIYLVDAGGSLLAAMSKKSQEEAYKTLDELGVIVKLNVAVKDFSDNIVLLADGTQIPTATLIWASGVIAREVPGLPPETVMRGRRISVDAHNRVLGMNDVFVIGDQSFMVEDRAYANGHPQLAQVAIQQGILLAKNFRAIQQNQPLKPFSYTDKGSMAIISKFKAVVDMPKLFLKGFVAWLAWLLIHIIPIAGFRNKGKLAMNWLLSFITNDPTLRLIIRSEKSIQGKSMP